MRALLNLVLMAVLAGVALRCGGAEEPVNTTTPTSTMEPRIELKIEQVDVPGATGTVVNDISDSGTVVGVFLDAQNVVHGFMRDQEKFTTLDAPDAQSTFPQTINNANEVAGDFADSQGRSHGFRWRNNTFETIECPDGHDSYITGANSEGALVGDCVDANGIHEGFLYRGGAIEIVKRPEGFESYPSAFMADLNSRGDLLGFVGGGAGGKVSFLLRTNGEVEKPPQPVGVAAQPFALSDNGSILGQYFLLDASKKEGFDPDRPVGGYLVRDGQVQLLTVPGATLSAPVGLNNKGMIVGFFNDANSHRHGFLAQLQ